MKTNDKTLDYWKNVIQLANRKEYDEVLKLMGIKISELMGWYREGLISFGELNQKIMYLDSIVTRR